MKIDVRIPISPLPHFFRQVEYLWRSFRVNGGIAAGARFIVSVGEDCEPFDLYERLPWSRGEIEWRWVNREAFKRLSYSETALDRFRHSSDADVVLLSDADTLLIRNIDDLLGSLVASPAVAGVMAYLPPFFELPGVTWRSVFQALNTAVPADRYQHAGWRSLLFDNAVRFGPIYYNFGAVFVPGNMLAALGEAYESFLTRTFAAPIHPQFHAQLALTMAIYKLNLPRVALEPRYNFPNIPEMDAGLPIELNDVRIIHCLHEQIIGSRRDTWGSDERFAAFLGRTDLRGSNEIVRLSAARLRAKIPSTAG